MRPQSSQTRHLKIPRCDQVKIQSSLDNTSWKITNLKRLCVLNYTEYYKIKMWLSFTPISITYTTLLAMMPPLVFRNMQKKSGLLRFGIDVIQIFVLFILLAIHNTGEHEGTTFLGWLGLGITINSYIGAMVSAASCCVLYFGMFCQMLASPVELDEPSDEFDTYETIWTPIYKELIFRSFIFTAHICAGIQPMFAIMLTSILYAGFHLRLSFKADELANMMITCMYNVIFSFFTTLVYYYTGSLYGCIVIAYFSASMGIPDLSFLFDPKQKIYVWRKYLVLGYIASLVVFVKLVPLMINPEFFNSQLLQVAKTLSSI